MQESFLTPPPLKEKPTRNALGTINGCYIPCLLNILGAPLFLFVGFAVGMLGWPAALALFCFSELIAYLTITSFSALVTNGRMKGGGAYYMISRSLGPAFGGSSGLLFWLTYCVNVTFNTSAFTDTVFSTMISHGVIGPSYATCTLETKCWAKLGFSTAILFVLFVIAFIGAAAFARVNYFIFAGLVVALIVSIGTVWTARDDRILASNLSSLQYTPADLTQFVDVSVSFRPWALSAECPEDPINTTSWCHLGTNVSGGNGRYGLMETLSYSPAPSGQCDAGPHSTVGTLCNLPHVFSFVFPAVVGMMEGANLSGDLADPGRSIPRGTIAAVSTAFLCYILLIFGQAGTMDRGALQYDLNVMQQSCVNEYFVVLGIATACLSTALGSMFGSARIMQALARDNIYPPLRIFAAGSLKGDEPRRALVLTYLLAQAGLLYGGIEAVAPVLTNFFLVTYTLTNLSTCLLELAHVPNFRPEWRYYSWQTSLLGACLTIVAMFFLNWLFALVTILIVILLFVLIYSTFDASSWVDISHPLSFLTAKAALSSLSKSSDHPKFWRPNTLLILPPPKGVISMASSAERDLPLVRLASQISDGGLLVVGRPFTQKMLDELLMLTTQHPRHGGDGEAVLGAGALRAKCAVKEQLDAAIDLAKRSMKLKSIDAFDACAIGESLRVGCIQLALTSGLGPMRTSVVALPLPPRGGSAGGAAHSFTNGGVVDGGMEHAGLIADLTALKQNVVLMCNCGTNANGAVFGLPTCVLEPSVLSAKGRSCRIDVWLFGEVPKAGASLSQPSSPSASASNGFPTTAVETAADVPQQHDAGLVVQFGFLAHRALAKARTWGSPYPKLRVVQVLPPSADPSSLNQADPEVAAGVRFAPFTPPGEAFEGGPSNGVQVASAAAQASLKAYLKELRVNAEPIALEAHASGSALLREWSTLKRGAPGELRDMVRSAVGSVSADAALVVMPLPTPEACVAAELTEASPAAGYVDALHALTAGLPPTLLCRSGGEPVVTTEI